MRYFLTLIFCLFTLTASAQYTHWGSFPDGGTLPFLVNTLGQDGAGETPASEAIAVYKDSSDTELTTGVAIDDDIDSRTGLHRVTIDTTQSGFDAGSIYFIVYTAGTSDSVSLTARVLGSFTIGPIDSDVREWLGTAAATPTTAGVPEVDVTLVEGVAAGTALIDAAGIQAEVEDGIDAKLTAIASQILDAGYATPAEDSWLERLVEIGVAADAILVDTAEIGAAGAGLTNINLPNQTMDITGNITGNLSGSVGSISGISFPTNFSLLSINGSGHIARVTLADTVTTLTGHTAQTGDAFARLGAPAGASVSADIAAIEAQTDDIGVAGAGLTALATQASVNTIDTNVDSILAWNAVKENTEYTYTTTAVREAGGDPEVRTITVEFVTP